MSKRSYVLKTFNPEFIESLTYLPKGTEMVYYSGHFKTSSENFEDGGARMIGHTDSHLEKGWSVVVTHMFTHEKRRANRYTNQGEASIDAENISSQIGVSVFVEALDEIFFPEE